MSHAEEDKTFEKIHLLEAGSYEQCRFVDCDFSNADLAEIAFIDCVFQDCNLLLVNTSHTSLQTVEFINCKLSGVNFGRCRDFAFAVSFERCVLDNAVFFKRKMKGTRFAECSLLDADFTECDLSSAAFEHCNLQGALFDRTNLKQADLRTSYNFIIDPEANDLRKAKFSVYGLPGLVAKYGVVVE